MTKAIELAAKSLGVSNLSLLVFIALDLTWMSIEIPADMTIVGILPSMLAIGCIAFIVVFFLEWFMSKKPIQEAFSIALALGVVAAFPTCISSFLFGGAKIVHSTAKILLPKSESKAQPSISPPASPK